MTLKQIIKETVKYTVGIGVGMDIGQVVLHEYRKGIIKACDIINKKLGKNDISEEAKDEENKQS